MSKLPWGKIGNWAAESERAEEEEREEAAKAAAEAASMPAPHNFPSLKDGLGTAKQSKKKMTLQEFTNTSAAARGLTSAEMLRLPTGPREHSYADEMPYGSGRLGGGFSNYGNRPSGPPPDRYRDRGSYGSEGPWGDSRRSHGGFENDPRMGARPDFDQTFRADVVNNWATMKKPLPSYSPGPVDGQGPRPSRYASLGGGGGGGPSKADELDNWASTKKPIPPPATRSYAFGLGAGESRPEPDRWNRDGNQERRTFSLHVSKDEDGGGVVKVNKPNPFGAARPREDVLAEKGLDWKKLDLEIEAKKVVSRPTSSHSSRPGSSQSNRPEGLTLEGIGEGSSLPITKSNPFGGAKPREVILEKKGLDWRKIDLKLDHRRVERSETNEEKNLKEEIEHLKHEMMQKSREDQSSLHDLVLQKDMELALLIQDLDAKIRFGQKPFERPGSGAGRFTGPAERTPFHAGGYEEHRAGEFMERPHSRGTGVGWHRSIDDRRPSQRGRGRGYSGGRDMERSFTRGRW